MAIMCCDYISKTLRCPFQMLRDDFSWNCLLLKQESYID